jgi:hypothetical protein
MLVYFLFVAGFFVLIKGADILVALGIMVNGSFLNNEARNLPTRSDGLLLLLFFSIFIYYSCSIAADLDGKGQSSLFFI